MALVATSASLKNKLGNVGSGGGLNRVGLLTNSSGKTYTCYYSPVDDTIYFEADDTNKVAPKLEGDT